MASRRQVDRLVYELLSSYVYSQRSRLVKTILGSVAPFSIHISHAMIQFDATLSDVCWLSCIVYMFPCMLLSSVLFVVFVVVVWRRRRRRVGDCRCAAAEAARLTLAPRQAEASLRDPSEVNPPAQQIALSTTDDCGAQRRLNRLQRTSRRARALVQLQLGKGCSAGWAAVQHTDAAAEATHRRAPHPNQTQPQIGTTQQQDTANASCTHTAWPQRRATLRPIGGTN